MATMASFQAVFNIGCAAVWVSVGLQWNRQKKAFEAEYNNYFEKSSNIRAKINELAESSGVSDM